MRAIGVITIGLAAFAACGGDETTPGRLATDGRLRSATLQTPIALGIPTKQPWPTPTPLPTPTPSMYFVTPTPTSTPLPPHTCCTPPPHHVPQPQS